MCLVDIAYDEIPERHYKESEVSHCHRVMSVCLGGVMGDGDIQEYGCEQKKKGGREK